MRCWSGYAQILPAKICCLKFSGKLPMGLGIPPLKFKILPESSPLKSRILVRRLAVSTQQGPRIASRLGTRRLCKQSGSSSRGSIHTQSGRTSGCDWSGIYHDGGKWGPSDENKKWRKYRRRNVWCWVVEQSSPDIVSNAYQEAVKARQRYSIVHDSVF